MSHHECLKGLVQFSVHLSDNTLVAGRTGESLEFGSIFAFIGLVSDGRKIPISGGVRTIGEKSDGNILFQFLRVFF